MSLQQFKDKDGNFIHHTWPGFYPVYYVNNADQTVCAACASDPNNIYHIVLGVVLEEGPNVICEDGTSPMCQKVILGDEEEVIDEVV